MNYFCCRCLLFPSFSLSHFVSLTDGWRGFTGNERAMLSTILLTHKNTEIRSRKEAGRKIINAENESFEIKKEEKREVETKQGSKNELYFISCPVRFNFPVEIGFLIYFVSLHLPSLGTLKASSSLL